MYLEYQKYIQRKCGNSYVMWVVRVVVVVVVRKRTN